MSLITTLTTPIETPTTAEITALAQAAAGQYQRPFIESFPSYIMTSTGANSQPGRTFFVLVDPLDVALTISTISVLMGVASGNIDLGVCSYDGTTMTRIVSKGSTAATGSNVLQSLAVTPSAVGPGRRIYLSYGEDNATVQVGRLAYAAPQNGKGDRVLFKDVFPIPATCTGLAPTSYTPWIFAE